MAAPAGRRTKFTRYAMDVAMTEVKNCIELSNRILDTIRRWGEERGGLDGNEMAVAITLAITHIGTDIDPEMPKIVSTILAGKFPHGEQDAT
jgi:hypothetical protein